MSKIKTHVVLKRALLEKKMTVVDLSRLTGIPKTTLSNWLVAGNKPKDPDQVAVCAKALGLTLSQIYFDSVEESTPGIETMQTEVVLDGFYRVRLEKVILKK